MLKPSSPGNFKKGLRCKNFNNVTSSVQTFHSFMESCKGQHYVHVIYQNQRTLMSPCTLRSHLASRARARALQPCALIGMQVGLPLSLCKHPYYSRHTNTFSPYFAHNVQAGGGRPSGKGISIRGGGGGENLKDSVTRIFQGSVSPVLNYCIFFISKVFFRKLSRKLET
jgi:hypothetical protein